jgi:iron complex outermembrane receptor protein
MKISLTNALKTGAAPLVIGVALLASPAFAAPEPSLIDGPQAEAAAPAEAAQIVVTGTRFTNPNLKSAAPITTVTALDLKLAGTSRTEDILNQLPQVFASQSSTLSNGANGTATVDLRGLGPKRTLVLINGRRLMSGDPSPTGTTSAADLNFIPTSLVKRVDVLTGGASATYGADAVSGVVNFILDKDFTGFRVDLNDGMYQHNNGSTMVQALMNKRTAAGISGYDYPTGNRFDANGFDGTISFGTKFADGAGHMMAYVGYRKQNALLQKARDYSGCTIQNANASTLQCGGSSTSANGNALYFPQGSTSSTFGTLGAGTFGGSRTRYNFAPLNYFQRPDQRYTAGLFADYEINSAIHPYLEFMFMDDRTVAQIAPSGDFGNTNTINCDNPLMSAQQKSTICNSSNMIVGYLGSYPVASGFLGNLSPAAQALVTAPSNPNTAFFQLLRRNVEGGPRISDLQHTSFRTIMGSKGDLGHGWAYDVYFQYGRTNYSQTYSNEWSAARTRNALDVVTGPGGTPVCRVTLSDPSSGCSPLNIWNGQPLSAAALKYVSAVGFQKGAVTEQILSGSLTGDLGTYGIKSPFATTGVNLALGVERRSEALYLNTDQAFQTGDLTGQGAPTLPISGSYLTTEVLGEVAVPVIENMLYFNGAYRYSDYKVSNGKKYTTNTFKAEVDFRPVDGIRLRGSFNRAVRAPNIQELFAANYVGLDGSTDPCTGVVTAAQVGCLAQGLRVGQNVVSNPAAQYNGFLGGNPDLRPETANTKTLGVVLTPAQIRGLTVSVDWFDIKVNNAIQSIGADALLGACNTEVNAVACAQIHRNPAGSLWLSSEGYVKDLNSNIGWVKTSGIEVKLDYAKSLDNWGKLSFSLTGTALSQFATYNGLTEAYDCAGNYGPTCGSPAPKWRHRARILWDTPIGIQAGLGWRYIAPVDVEYTNASKTLANKNFAPYNFEIGSYSYFDLTLSGKVGKHAAWRTGVNNLLDKDPPLVTTGGGAIPSACQGTYCNGNTYPGTYDALGRYLYAGVTFDF